MKKKDLPEEMKALMELEKTVKKLRKKMESSTEDVRPAIELTIEAQGDIEWLLGTLREKRWSS